MIMANEFAHIELMTHDLEAAREFYTELFDWQWEKHEMEGGDYWMIDTGIDPKGGMMKAPEADIPPHWMIYTKVENVAETLEKAKALGAEIFKEATPIPGMGAFGIFQDPTGGVMSVWEPAPESEPE
jgi:predicted enzyme related to lactoylglutathione lyase